MDGYVTQRRLLDDGDVGINPGIVEVCDGTDNNCDGGVDEGISTTAWYADSDGDLFGNSALSTYNCLQPNGYVVDSQDCDDGDVAVNPDATEVCNGIDDDCDGDSDVGHLGLDMTCLADSCLEI